MQHNHHVYAWYYVGRLMWLRTIMLNPDIAAKENAKALAEYRSYRPTLIGA